MNDEERFEAMSGRFMLVQMDRENRIESFEEIGLIDPFNTKSSIKQATSIVGGWDFYHDVYEEKLLGSLIE